MAGLDRDGVVVEFALDDVNADVLNQPVLVVSGEDLKVGFTFAIRRLPLSKEVILAWFVPLENSVDNILSPAILERVIIL